MTRYFESRDQMMGSVYSVVLDYLSYDKFPDPLHTFRILSVFCCFGAEMRLKLLAPIFVVYIFSLRHWFHQRIVVDILTFDRDI